MAMGEEVMVMGGMEIGYTEASTKLNQSSLPSFLEMVENRKMEMFCLELATLLQQYVAHQPKNGIDSWQTQQAEMAQTRSHMPTNLPNAKKESWSEKKRPSQK